MNMPGLTAEASLDQPRQGLLAIFKTLASGNAQNSNLVEPAGCIVYDWVDFWLETGEVTDYGGMICTR